MATVQGNADAHDPLPNKLRDAIPRQIVHAVLSMDCGGLEQLVLQLCRVGHDHGQIHNVICVDHPGVLSTAVEEIGASVYCVEKGSGLRPLYTQRKLVPILRELRPDIVHSHQMGALLHVGWTAKRQRVPVVHTEHGKHFSSFRTRMLGRVAGRHAERFVCVSDDIASDVRRRSIVENSKIGVIRNGIDTLRV